MYREEGEDVGIVWKALLTAHEKMLGYMHETPALQFSVVAERVTKQALVQLVEQFLLKLFSQELTLHA